MAQSHTQTYEIGTCKVALYGEQLHLNSDAEISRLQAIELGAHPEYIAQIVTASSDKDPGYRNIVHDVFGKKSQADGVLLKTPRSAGIIQTADCPAVILYDTKSHQVVLAHAGRPAVSPSGHCTSCTVVGNALHALIGSDGDPTTVFALVVGNICGPCFKHDHASATHLIEPFFKLPAQVFADRALGALDLYEVIKHQLLFRGVLEENIRHEGPCTLETEGLSSYRRDQTLLRNTIIVVRQ